MENFPKYYTYLFNCITDAIEALQEQKYDKAQDILILAQQEAEEMYLSDTEEEGDDVPKYNVWQFGPILDETERLMMESLYHESKQEFLRIKWEQGFYPKEGACPEALDCEKEEGCHD